MSIFKLPDLGEGLPDAEIHEWYVAEGDVVKLDQPLVSMETAKAVVDVPSPQNGKIIKLHGKPGDIIPTGSPLIEFEAAEGAAKASADAGTVVGKIETSDVVLQESPTGIQVQSGTRSGVRVTPAVRALANKLNVDLTTVKGSGPNGTITLEDVNQAAAGGPSPSAPTQVQGEQLHGARRVMAHLMAKSHAEVVPVTLIEDVDLHQWPEKVDFTVRLLQAIVTACKAEPALNAHFYGQSTSRKLFSEVNIGVAVDTPEGLYVPVIKNAQDLSSEALRAQLNSMKDKAMNQSFAPEELQNSTIVLSNFGTITGKYANPIIVPPTVAIIGIGKTRPTVVAFEGQPAVHPVMPICLTFDHRAITGGEAARFLAAMVQALEK